MNTYVFTKVAVTILWARVHWSNRNNLWTRDHWSNRDKLRAHVCSPDVYPSLSSSRMSPAGRDRIVVSTLRCGRNNPGSNPGHGSGSRSFFGSRVRQFVRVQCLFVSECLLNWTLYYFLSWWIILNKTFMGHVGMRPCGAMDNASAYGAEDSRFESWQGRFVF